ncbi:MAG: hypothetical protein ABEL76_03560, partial [Bradymonadaceae bacterium]
MEDEDVSNDLRLVRSLLSRSPESTADGASLAGIVRALDRHDASSEGDAYRTWRRLLPWLEARRAVESGDEPGAVAGRLREAGAVRMLAARTVVRELQSRGVAPDDQEAIVLALERLVDREFALRSCSDAADDELFAELMADAGLLAAAIDLCAVDDGEFARRLRRAVPPLGREEADWPARSRSLGILADLESGRADVLAGADDLGDRVRRFETGLVDNLRHQGFGDVVRAALAFGSRRRCSVEEIRVPLRSETFCGSPARVRLARELAAVRGRVLRCIRGRLPLSGLHRWVEYLTVCSRRLAEELGVTHAEAAGYAHYCLHLVDVCDLAADGRLAAETRAGILSVEE